MGTAALLAIFGGALPFAVPGEAKLAWKCAKVVMNGANRQREDEMAALKEELAEIERQERILGLR
jgi:hypothetical protein